MDKELIDHIKSQLKEHEETYTPGAWERFDEKNRKRKGIIYWPLWTAAAVILVLLGLFFSINQEKTLPQTVRVKQKVDATGLQKKPSTTKEKPTQDKGLKNLTEQANLARTQNNRFSQENKKSTTSKVQNNSSVQTDLKPDLNVILGPSPGLAQLPNSLREDLKLQLEKATVPHAKTFEELLASDSKAQLGKNSDKTLQNSKWESAVYVAPAVGNDNKVNVNYGFSLSYAVANKLSISSGVSYASLSSSETLTNSSPQTLTGKNLSAVTAKLSGINVPLELRYNISDRLYTGVGVSALAVLNNSQNNTYLSNEVQTFASPSTDQTLEAKKYIVQEKTVEPQAPQSVAPDNYIGFYNFSLGYKQKISKKNNISVEPFLQLPMKTFSKENLNLTNGGVRLKFDF